MTVLVWRFLSAGDGFGFAAFVVSEDVPVSKGEWLKHLDDKPHTCLLP